MKQFLFILMMLMPQMVLLAQSPDQSIKKIMATQEQAWNNADIETFMSGYWNNDSLLFVGKSGPTYGWQNTLNNYKRNYDTKEKMGKLAFTILQIKKLDKEHYFVLGKWQLTRTVGDIGGHFTLIFQQFKNGWKIVSDHSS